MGVGKKVGLFDICLEMSPWKHNASLENADTLCSCL